LRSSGVTGGPLALVTTKPFYPLRCLTQRDIQDAEIAEVFFGR
jgi:hypothetical protein